jgi:DNA adenine methylase
MLEPFLKWPGGKRWLMRQVAHLLPSVFNRFIEPFVGGGAAFFHLCPTSSVLADTNTELMNTYCSVRQHPQEIERKLQSLDRSHSAELYYRIRDGAPNSRLEQAIRFIYLNRTCFNGIYRVNRSGHFNVPLGSKKSVAYPEGYLADVAHSLRRALLHTTDFEETIACAKRGDFLFVDPPYTVSHNNNNFIKYNSHLFSWSDQTRLAETVMRAARRGVKVMICNANHESIRELYSTFGHHHHVHRATTIAADAQNRGRTTELVITKLT